MFMLVFFLYDTVPYQESTTLQTLPHSSSGGQHYFIKNISRTSAVSSTNFRSILIFASCVVCVYVRSQSTDSRQDVESSTLQPCCTAAVVGDTIYLCALGVSSLCCGELLVSEPVIICHPTIPHVSAVLPLWVRVSIDAAT